MHGQNKSKRPPFSADEPARGTTTAVDPRYCDRHVAAQRHRRGGGGAEVFWEFVRRSIQGRERVLKANITEGTTLFPLDRTSRGSQNRRVAPI